MRRRAAFFVVMLAGSLLGACAMLVVDDLQREGGRLAGTEAEPAITAASTAGDPVLLVWTPDGLPPGFADAVRAAPSVTRLTEVRGDLAEIVDVSTPPGFVIPLDALSVEPESYSAFLPKEGAAAVAALGPGEVVLGETSARLRRLGVGGVVQLATGESLRVAAVLDDVLVGAAELVVAHDVLPAIGTPRFLLVAYEGPRELVERAMRALLPPATAIRFRAPGETPLLRHGDAVLPPATVKEKFGEFSYRRLEGRELELDPTWVREHVVDVDLPLLGPLRCHRAIVEPLRAALLELERRNLGYLVSRDGFRGCFVPRLVSVDGGVSRHAWGTALDLNYPKNREGELGSQDERLVDVMAAHGFTWGGPWLDPDPAHFEWVGVLDAGG